MSMELEIEYDDSGYIEWEESECRMREYREEAQKHIDRWQQVIRAELQRMREEGIDPFIAWLAIDMFTDMFDIRYGLSELKPTG